MKGEEFKLIWPISIFILKEYVKLPQSIEATFALQLSKTYGF